MKAVCFKSIFPSDGCSTLLLCAVRALMERNYRILLIDSHHRHIDLPNQLNLSGDCETGTAVIPLDDHLDLWVWQESKTVEENTTLIAEIIAKRRDKYDFILLDDGSVTESPLPAFVAFWNQMDLNGVVLVSNTKRPSEMPVSHIVSRLRQYNVPLIGIAENYV
jgi:Mrp family chromosome partitioning ATPase